MKNTRLLKVLHDEFVKRDLRKNPDIGDENGFSIGEIQEVLAEAARTIMLIEALNKED
jgi:hypothetical protein